MIFNHFQKSNAKKKIGKIFDLEVVTQHPTFLFWHISPPY
jgi:hypothetical protein